MLLGIYRATFFMLLKAFILLKSKRSDLMLNYKLMNEWLSAHDLTLERGFVETLRAYAKIHKKNRTEAK